MTASSARAYHPIVKWRCTRCKAWGKLDHPARESADEIWKRVLVAHDGANPMCLFDHPKDDGGIVLDPQSGTLPID
jgi:hypothetical protein